MCGTVAFAKVVQPDPGDLHPSVFQFGPQGFGLTRYPDDTARPDRQEITRQPVGILFGNRDDGGTDTVPQQFDEPDIFFGFGIDAVCTSEVNIGQQQIRRIRIGGHTPGCERHQIAVYNVEIGVQMHFRLAEQSVLDYDQTVAAQQVVLHKLIDGRLRGAHPAADESRIAERIEIPAFEMSSLPFDAV